jgi:hypothetical protein
MNGRWTESARNFMRQTIKADGIRHVGSASKYHELAFNLCHDHGMLQTVRYYRCGKQGVWVYSVTERGRLTFGEES